MSMVGLVLPDSAALRRQTLQVCLRRACMLDVEALKPGNVSIHAEGHGMDAGDFAASAQAIAEPITAPGLGVGERILAAVEATRAEVGCNTNLGIVLLCAPLVHAMLHGADAQHLRRALKSVLDGLTVRDAAAAYRAIRIASPGGLGTSAAHDVRDEPVVTLRQAMAYAQERDRIALQYVTGFGDVFDVAVPRLREARALWGNEEWSTTACYLALLARFPDSHVARKLGDHVAGRLQHEAQAWERLLWDGAGPAKHAAELLEWDASLKARGINPGTSADLTVAALYIVLLEDAADLRETPVPGIAESGPEDCAGGDGQKNVQRFREPVPPPGAQRAGSWGDPHF